MMNKLTNLHVEGFRSIKDASIEFRALNVMIGANGAGKSNLIDFFRMLNYSLTRGFQDPYLRERGPASSVLHFGSKETGVIRSELTFSSEAGSSVYRFTLADSEGDRLTFTKEEVVFQHDKAEKPASAIPLIQHPSDNSGLCELWAENDKTARFTKGFLQRCRVYQFHDTSITSHMRDYTPVDQGNYLRADAGNLSAVLFELRNEDPQDYMAVVRTLQSVLPWFGEFVLNEDGRKGVLLRWRMQGHAEYEMGPSQLSDGSLRIMALVSLLLSPPDRLPSVIIIDEPELGLHPSAERVVAGLIRNASRHCQIIISTQSAGFIDHFDADDIVVVENSDGASQFVRQSRESLKGWLDRYTLSQLWNKDVLGGRP